MSDTIEHSDEYGSVSAESTTALWVSFCLALASSSCLTTEEISPGFVIYHDMLGSYR